MEERLERIINKLGLQDKISVAWLKDFTYNFDLPTNQINKKYFGRLPLTDEEQLWKDHFDRARAGLDPYLDWAYKEVLPKYDSYIKNLKLKKPDDVVGVAGIFLETCGQMGFFEFNRLHPMFIKDFPRMFKASVRGPKISQPDIAKHLDTFLFFLETYYPTNAVPRVTIG